MSETKTKTIYEKLANIQKAIKVEKDQWNDFGKFKYRNAETILKNLKPLLEENKATILMTDEIVEVGGFNYMKATVALLDLESDNTVNTTAFAKEPLEKKGMDASQITGASSSYARKYALCGLLAIDDGNDNDKFDNSDAKATPKNAGHKIDFKSVREKIKKCSTVDELNNLWFSLADASGQVPDYVDKYLKEDFTKRKNEIGE